MNNANEISTTEALAATPFTTVAFHHMLAIEGLQLPAHRVAQAAEGYQELARGLTELRRVPLPFLTDVPEPANADRWIEAGGHI
jgi:hypothetical protein